MKKYLSVLSFLSVFACWQAAKSHEIDLLPYYDNIVVGAGLSGATIAERIASQSGETVLVIDKRSHPGGNVYDYKDTKSGITVQKYGIHAFHTNNEAVWRYLSHFTIWKDYHHTALAETSRGLVNFPVNLNTIEQLFAPEFAAEFTAALSAEFKDAEKISVKDLQNHENEVLRRGANILYEELFKNYTMKQWGLSVEEVDPSVIARVPIYLNRENAYFTDKYQALPLHGYTTMIKKMLDNPNITLQLDTDWADIKDKVHYKRLFYTGSIDEFFDYKFGRLPYRSLNFEIKTLPQEHYQPTAQVNHPNHESMTRSIEHKYLLDEKSAQTVVSFEYPLAFDGENERYYPINQPENAELYAKYLEEAKQYPNVYFLGRLGDYKYYNMDQAVARALELYDTVFASSSLPQHQHTHEPK